MASVYVSSVIQKPVEEVWQHVCDFNALPSWHPSIKDSEIENGLSGDRVGCVRNFNLKQGGNIRERLLGLSDIDHICRYSILESPMPVSNYVASLQLHSITDGNHTFAVWKAEFDSPAEKEKELVELIGNGVFQAGFDALKKHFGA